MPNAWPMEELVLSHFEFEGFRTVMPALRLRSGQAPAGIQGEQAAACGYSAWIPAFAGMTQHSPPPHNHHDRLLGGWRGRGKAELEPRCAAVRKQRGAC